MTSLQHLTSIILLWNDWKLENFGKIQTFLGLKRQKIVRMHKTCLTSQFLRLSLARFSREMAYLPSRKNLANESLRNCDIRQVLCILTIFCRFKHMEIFITTFLLIFHVYKALCFCGSKAVRVVKLIQQQSFFRVFPWVRFLQWRFSLDQLQMVWSGWVLVIVYGYHYNA